MSEISQKQLRRVSKYGKKTKSVKINTPALTNPYSNTIMDMMLLERCFSAWSSLHPIRDRAHRAHRYRRGDQWGDLIKNPDGLGYIKESDYIASQGRTPLKQNFISAMVRNVVGQFRSNPTQTTVIARAREDALVSEMLTNALQAVQEVNQSDELNAQNLDMFVIGGLAVGKTTFRKTHPISHKPDVFDKNVNIDRYFFNPDVEDIRGLDIRLEGEIHDYTIDQLVATFAKNETQAQSLREIYGSSRNTYEAYDSNRGGQSNSENISFHIPDSPHLCRVIEAWEKVGKWQTRIHDKLNGEVYITEDKESVLKEENDLRTAQAMDNGVENIDDILLEWEREFVLIWRVSYLSPWGHVLMRMDTPYNHLGTPYNRAWSLTGKGDILSLVEDFIDQQRYINRLITMLDFLIGVSAKGMLLVPEDCIPEDMDISDFASEYSKVGGVVKYKPRNDKQIPIQISTNSVNVGAFEMLNIQLGFLQQTSGLSGAIQGHDAKSGTPSSLYAQQAQNAQVNFKHMFDIYAAYIKNKDEKMLRTLIQFYDSKRYIITSGKSYAEAANTFDPELVESITDMALIVGQAVNTPTFRQIIDDQLFKLLESGGIDIKMYLENSSLPYADRILDSIKKRDEAISNGNSSQGFTPDQVQQIQQAQTAAGQQANPKVMELLNRIMNAS